MLAARRSLLLLPLLFVPVQPSAAAEGGAARLERALEAGDRALAARESQIAESSYREALFEGWLLLGTIARQRGDLAAAKQAFEAAVLSVVDTRRARLPLALTLSELDEHDEAEVVLRGLIGEDPGDGEARRLLARVLADAGRLGDSVQELEQLRFLIPGDSEIDYLLATAYLQQGRAEAADELLAELAAAIPTPQTQILIGRTYRDAELYERARQAFERALAIDPAVRRAHYYLGSIHLLDGGVAALEAAAGELERELEVSPGDEITNLYLGMARVEQRRYEDAIPALEIAGRRDDLAGDALRFLGRALLETGRTTEAVEVLRRGLAAVGGSAAPPPAPVDGASDAPAQELSEFRARQLSSLHYQLAQALRAAGDGDAARFHFAEAKRFQAESAESARESLDRYLADETGARTLQMSEAGPAPDAGDAELGRLGRSIETAVARAYFNLGVLELRGGEFAAAAELLARASELDAESPRLDYSLGVARFNAGQHARAVEPLARAAAADPGDESLRRMLALAYLNSGRYDEAAAAFESLGGDLGDRSLRYAYGLALVRSGRGAEAEEVFERLLRDSADWPELNVVLGQAFAQQGNFAAAVAAVEHAIELDPDVAEAHATLGEIHLRRGEIAEAEEALRRELRAHPDDARAQYTLATVLDLAQKPEEAMALLRSLLEEQPDLAKGRFLLGKLLLARGSLDAARDQLEAAAGLAPEDANIRYQLGQAYQKLGLAEDARAQFETFRALRRAADGPPAGADS